uniref:ATP binding cassette subfamily A member 10 n=1 Tax=Gopherus evgoodei TaxID=1825980 RepID=A0A8C4VVH8_9SAUR
LFELLLSLLMPFILYTDLISGWYRGYPELPSVDLGRVDEFDRNTYAVQYTPVTQTTRQIMQHMASVSFLNGTFPPNFITQLLVFYISYRCSASIFYQAITCSVTEQWTSGFVPLQANIDAAIIQVASNHSVMEELQSVTAEQMRLPPFRVVEGINYDFFLICCAVAFSPLIYFMSLNVAKERRKFKELMKMMALQDFAFWLSWGLLYAGYILIMAILLTFTIKSEEFIYHTSHSVIFFLFYLYGISLISLAFLLSSLLKKPKLTGIVGFLFTLSFGSLGLVVLYNHIPEPLEWVLSLFSPFAFTAGFVRILHLEDAMKGVEFSDFLEDSFPMLAFFFLLVFDALLYLVLAIYFDKVLPDKYGMHHSCLFFLKPSYWFKKRKNCVNNDILDYEEYSDQVFNDYVEQVPPEFRGKEAIRYGINNVKKTYKGKDKTVNALRGLLLNVYEGQITALLGHSGAGKSTLLNILSGLCPPSEGSAMIYKYKVTEMEDLEEIRKIIGVCPQFNVQFEVLTVKENLRIFAKIKGIPLKEVLILDEPTAGLDISSRYHVWSLLKEHKANRVTLFSTQLTDEADIIADRKAFISHGRLKCVGSSLFLKRKWGIGYHLSLHINDSCDSAKMTSLVQQHISNAKLSGQSHEELIYMLPFENVDKFPELFCDLDTHVCREILSYGISMTTLADVFLTLEEEATIDQAGKKEQAEEERDTFSPHELKQSLLSLSDTGKATVRGRALWRQQVCALARIRFLKLKHESQAISDIRILLGMVLSYIIQIWTQNFSQTRVFGWDLHFDFIILVLLLSKNHISFAFSNLLGSDIEDFIHAVKSQNIMLEVANGKNISDGQEYNGAIKVSLVDKHFRFSMMCHVKRINCFPVLMNIISNALLRNLNSTRLLWHSIIFMSVLASGFAPHFAMSSTGDYKIKAHSQLWTSGMFPSAYWCGQALVDIPLYSTNVPSKMSVIPFLSSNFVLLIVCVGMMLILILSIQVVSIFGYAASIVVLTYVISFAFRKRKSYSDLWSFIFIFAFITTILTAMIPFYTLAGCIRIIVKVLNQSFAIDVNGFRHFTHCLLLVFQPYLHCIILIFILRCLEWKYGRKTTREDPIFRISPRKEIFCQNPEESEGEDEDVQAERMKAGSVMTCQNQEERPILSVNSLRKEYKDKKVSSIFKKRKKVATRNVSFCVKEGEVFGLLGPNGAGKSTTLKVIIGDTSLTAGQVGETWERGEGDTTDFLGYCPQENPLWPNLTVQEHLEVYAAVKGMRKEDAAVTIKRVVNALKLQELLQKPAKKLPAGISRKVCFALSMLGKPTLMLLDELSTGMDPMGQHHVWTAVRAALKNKKQGVILTTHYMKEAEALCDRVAIMVSGKLHCIGSIQYLKSKFGKGYLLEIKVKDPEQVDLIHAEITRIFPLAARQERYSSLMVYKIPMENVQSLSQAFFNLEAAKRTFDLEEYSLSQSTLEQVQCAVYNISETVARKYNV